MGEKTKPHREAADRHDAAALSHDRAATFWAGRGDQGRGELQRELADYERHGAELERRWADLVDRDVLRDPVRDAKSLKSRTRERVRQLSEGLLQMAGSLERAADIAEGRAQTLEQAGGIGDPAEERQAADFARTAAERARSQAEQWLKLVEQHES